MALQVVGHQRGNQRNVPQLPQLFGSLGQLFMGALEISDSVMSATL
jgi:hypothetical protein